MKSAKDSTRSTEDKLAGKAPGAPKKASSGRVPEDDTMGIQDMIRTENATILQNAFRSHLARNVVKNARDDSKIDEARQMLSVKENKIVKSINDYLKGSYGFLEDVFEYPNQLSSDLTLSKEYEEHLEQMYHLTTGLCYQFAKDVPSFIGKYKDLDMEQVTDDSSFIGKLVAIKLESIVYYFSKKHNQVFCQTFNDLIKSHGYQKELLYDQSEIGELVSNPGLDQSLQQIESDVAISFYSWMIEKGMIESIPPDILDRSKSLTPVTESVRRNVKDTLENVFKRSKSEVGIGHDLQTRIKLEERFFSGDEHSIFPRRDEADLDSSAGSCDNSFDSEVGGSLAHLGAGPGGSAGITPSSTPYKGVDFSNRRQVDLAANSTPQKLAASSPFAKRGGLESNADDQAPAASGQDSPSPSRNTRAGSVNSLVKKFEVAGLE